METTTCPAMSDTLGWVEWYRRQWERIAQDPSTPEWLRAAAEEEARKVITSEEL